MATGSSDWIPWVDYIVGAAANKYCENAPADNPAVWNVQVGGLEAGDSYAKSGDFTHEFETEALRKLSKEAGGTSTDIFGVPPKDYTIVNGVDCVTNQGELKVLTGKCKKQTNRMLYVANGKATCIVALVDITNCNRGVEGIALNAFAFAISTILDQI